MEQLDSEKKEKITKLKKRMRKKYFFLLARHVFICLIATSFITLLNTFYVKSQYFPIFGGFMTGIFLYNLFSGDFVALAMELKEELLKISNE
jgi:uncharacterized membrane protein YozB (DUF420 family)